MNTIPLEHGCNSWVITRKGTGERILETYNRSLVERVNQEKYRIETSGQYLRRINENISKYEIYV